ncbi:type 3 dihydrofolate reductase [Psychromonas sp. psych-6C06]|uniref:type 3 dihydrofolate reductase n=1 Tax=Psychromonas sp. psych-6C06 TaxID=2058089 RepID=UPI000C34FDC5|nr:type 3 dihydrofolate reductase [Psychromonas sp. psych-6C06]PKF62639.1 type 3 dihydrofolate reductase [Psychromonas sp. psych-6C06]
MRVSMIAAMANNRVIGLDNKMPWHLPADLQFFKRVTLGKPVIMGRKTYQSIGRPLPGRQNIVITRDESLQIEGVDCVQTLEQAIQLLGNIEEVMIIGGATIYEQFLVQADRLYLTFIDLETKGDTYFPDYIKSAKWRQVEQQSHTKDEKNGYNYQFVTLDRE